MSVALNSARAGKGIRAHAAEWIALVALALLRRGGYSARLAIGVRDAAVPGEGHAWIEVDGLPLDPLASDYTPLRRREAVGGSRHDP